MEKRPTSECNIIALKDVLEGTQLFPSALLPEMIADFLSGNQNDIWLSCALNAVPVGFCYAIREPMTEGLGTFCRLPSCL